MKNVFALTCLLLLCTQVSFAQAEVVQSFDLTKNNTVDFKLPHASDINVTPWSKDEVKIIAKVIISEKATDEGFSLQVDKKGKNIIVKSDLDYSKIPTFDIDLDEVDSWNERKDLSLIGQKGGKWQAVSYNIIYDIKVPTYLALDLCTSQGNVEVKGINTAMDIRTDNGFIDVARNPSDQANVKLSTNAGEIFTDFDIDQIEANQDHDGHHHGHGCQSTVIETTINGGGQKLSLSSTCGNIYLRKGK